MSAPELPLPDLDDELHAPFWDGTRERELRVQACASCGDVRWPPRPRCASCGSYEIDWRAVEPRGRLYTWIIANHAFGAAWKERVPYIVGIVELDEPAGVRFLGNLVDLEPSALEAGLPLKVRFDDVAPGVTLANWTSRSAGSSNSP